MKLELTDREWEIYCQMQTEIDRIMTHLATLSKEQRFEWYKTHQYPYPISFDREIGGTVYIVNTHFSGKTDEYLEERTRRILNSNSAL